MGPIGQIRLVRGGFTLIELIVVLGVFGILTIAGAEIFIQVIRNANRASMETEVRQNASKIMQDIVGETRRATAVSGSGDTLSLNGGGINYTVDVADNYSLKKNGTAISSPMVAVCTGSCGSCLSSGFTVSVGGGNAVTINLTVQQAPRFVRSDFCARMTLTETVTPRQY